MIAEKGRGNDKFEGVGDLLFMGRAVLNMRDFLGSRRVCRYFGVGIMASTVRYQIFGGTS